MKDILEAIKDLPDPPNTKIRHARPTGWMSGLVLRIRKHRGSEPANYYAAIRNARGDCVAILEAPDEIGWWTRNEAKASGAAWIREHAKPTSNI